jgi:CheY-like chemotaxis protein
MPELTPRDDIRKTVSGILKRVDHLVKDGNLDLALRETDRAKGIDPRNVYVHAYRERIASLQEEEKRKRAEGETRKKREEQARWKKEQAVERRGTAQQHQLRGEEALPTEGNHVKHRQQLEMYNQGLFEAWHCGAPSLHQRSQLALLRSSLNISPEEHLALENGVRWECYCIAVKEAGSSTSAIHQGMSGLEELRSMFKMSDEEHQRVLRELQWTKGSAEEKSIIVIVDDDENLLKVIAKTLEEADFVPKPFSTSDDALNFLSETKPDLIVSDINLQGSTMGGFSLYERLRERQDFENVPFLFLSGLTDEALIRKGKELGIDDYLTKPFSDQTFIAVIKRKLKRFRTLKKRESRALQDYEQSLPCPSALRSKPQF